MKKLTTVLMFIIINITGCGSSSNDPQTGLSIEATQSVAWENSGDDIEFEIDLGSPNETSDNIMVYFEVSGSALDRPEITENPELLKGYVEIPPGSQTAAIIIEGISGDSILTETQTITLRITGCSSSEYPVGAGSESTAVVMDGDGTTVIDIDGRTVYHTVKIGTQTWMVENLSADSLNDGTRLQMKAYRVPGFCWYNFNGGYGFLYNGAAVSTGKLCPCGWHVPTDAEFTTLIEYLGGAGVAGGKMKVGSSLNPWDGSAWSKPNTGADNSSGFTGYPGGYGFDDFKSTYPVFSHLGYYGIWWSSTGKSISLGFDTAQVYRPPRKNSDYCSVRCIKD